MLENLIGSKLISFDNDGFSVILPSGEQIDFVFDEDKGDCCGFNELSTELLISTDELSNNPIITNIEKTDTSGYDDDSVKIAFFGECKKIAEVNSLSSSGSGWNYGACVWVTCKQTGEEETITSY
jgi:hypothetical protein